MNLYGLIKFFDFPGGVTADDGSRGNILSYDGAGSDNGFSADSDSRQNYRPVTDPYPVFNDNILAGSGPGAPGAFGINFMSAANDADTVSQSAPMLTRAEPPVISVS